MLAGKGLPLEAKGRLYSACVRSVILYGSEAWPVIDENVIRLERNDANMITWMCNVRHEDRTSAGELRSRLKLKKMREFSQDRGFGHLERTEQNAWSSKCRTFKARGSFPRGRARKTWNEIIRSDLKERKVRKDIAKDRNV